MLLRTVLTSLSLCKSIKFLLSLWDGGGRGYFSGNKHKVAAPERGHSIPAYDSLQEDMAVKLLIVMLTVNYICDGGEMFLR